MDDSLAAFIGIMTSMLLIAALVYSWIRLARPRRGRPRASLEADAPGRVAVERECRPQGPGRPARGTDRGARADRHRSRPSAPPARSSSCAERTGETRRDALGEFIPIVADRRHRLGGRGAGAAPARARRRRRRPTSVADAQENARLAHENETLRLTVRRLEERMAVLERIATDPAERTAREIEQLR